jgi:hypothetical protein
MHACGSNLEADWYASEPLCLSAECSADLIALKLWGGRLYSATAVIRLTSFVEWRRLWRDVVRLSATIPSKKYLDKLVHDVRKTPKAAAGAIAWCTRPQPHCILSDWTQTHTFLSTVTASMVHFGELLW